VPIWEQGGREQIENEAEHPFCIFAPLLTADG